MLIFYFRYINKTAIKFTALDERKFYISMYIQELNRFIFIYLGLSQAPA